MLFVALILLGMLAGGIAWLIVRGGGARSINWPEAFLAGVIGSLLGGLLTSVLAGDGIRLAPSGLIGSTLGAVLVLVVWEWLKRRRRAAS